MDTEDLLAKDHAMRYYAAAHDDQALAAQTGDEMAHWAATILLRAYAGEMRDPKPEGPLPWCNCGMCSAYVNTRKLS